MKHISIRYILCTFVLCLTFVFQKAKAQAPVTFTSSDTWVCPPGLTKIKVECWGAGGGGGSRTNNGTAGGGGGGAYASSVITVVPGNTYTITIGNGGNATEDGGNTSFHTNLVMAVGGQGANLNNTTGGTRGLGSNCIGTIFFNGGNGANGGSNGGGGGGGAGSFGSGSNGSNQNGGNGGTFQGGKGGNGATSNGNGNPGANYGAGGGGAERSSGTRTGGAGADGLMIISPVIWQNYITGTNPNTANPFLNGDIVCNNVSVSGISRGSGISGSNANDRYAASGWTTSGSINTSDYFEFTITPQSGYAINLSSFQYTGQISSGASSHSFRSDLNNFATNIGSANATGTSISLSAAQYQNITSSITFRFYTYDVDFSSRVYSINDFVFLGSVFAVPTIANFSPNNACSGSGATVTINGSNLSDATAVRFNGVNASSFTVINDNQIQAVLPGGASTGAITVISPNATATSGTNFTVNPLPSFPAPFSVSSPSVCKGKQDVIYTVPLNAGVTYNWSYSGIGANFSSNSNSVSVDFDANATSGNLAVTASNACGTSSPRTISITLNDIPTVTISPQYCTGTGFVKLTASAGASYLWSTGETSSFINVDQAGNYQVTVTNVAGCAASADIDVAQELVLNGNFDGGNAGFTTAYTYSDVANGLYPEGTYAVNSNANFNHNLFYGTDHTSGSGNFMIINGSPLTGTTVWSQNGITVQPNTTYYFSAWGLSVHNTNKAVLQFSINGFQVGTIAYLPNGYSNNAGPYNWVRFYGSWNSGPATNADLSIVNLNTALGGNDFGLDDISFGTLSPTPLNASPIANSGGSICAGGTLFLSANATGGASPFTYAWTGPNGFVSSAQNPTVTTNASSTHNGNYALTITDGFGCQVNASVSVNVNNLPADKTVTALNASICSGTGSSIQVSNSEVGVYYQLRNNLDLSEIGAPVSGTGANILLPSGNLLTSTTFSVFAVSAGNGCGREMSIKPTITVNVTPVLAITNQSVCSGTVDLTLPAVTAGSTGGGTLSYWTDAATTIVLSNPTTVVTGTFYIKSLAGTCFDTEPVVVKVSNNPATSFSYPGTPFCTTENNPLPTFSGGGVAGSFSASPAGLIFASTSTGEINLAASAGGTYTITNAITPQGGCGTFSSNSTVIVTASPVASFQYTSNDLCQSANASDPAPIFINGGTGGTFSSSVGLNINSSSGVIDISECIPGNYAVVNTIAPTGGCASVADTSFININPYTFEGAVSASVTDEVICNGESTQLLSSGTSYLSTLLSEKFNGNINNWTTTNNSIGGTVNNAAWTLRPDGYNSGTTFNSNDNTQFYVSHSRNQNGTSTSTVLQSPQMSTIGYSTLSLNFWHYYNYDAKTGESAKVEVSTNGTIWTTVATYTSDQGSATNFTNPAIDLNAYIGYPIFYIRFNYYAGGRARYWAIDNVTIAGVSTNYAYLWNSSPAGFNSNDQNPAISPATNTFYILTATNTYGCSSPVSPVPVTVKQLPGLSSSLTPPAICSNTVFDYTPSSDNPGATFTWTRAALAGISNAAVVTPQNGNPNEVLYNTTASPVNVVYLFLITADGCSNSQQVTVTVNPKPLISHSGDVTVCNGTATILNSNVSNAQAPLSYAWLPVTGLNDPSVANPTATLSVASESYTLTVTDGNNCSAVSTPLTVTNFGFGGTPGLWTGSVNNDWNNCRNWSDGKVPTATTNVVINQTSANNCQVDGAAFCNSLEISSNDNNSPDLVIISSGVLTVSNDVLIQKSAGSGFSKLIMMGAAGLSCHDLSVTGFNAGEGNAVFLNEDIASQATINGELLINQGGKVILTDGNNLTPDATLHLKGNFTNNAQTDDFVGDLSTLIFDGTSTQVVSCPDGQKIANLVVNNSQPIGIVFNSTLQVEQSIEFTNGRIDLNGNDLILGTPTQEVAVNNPNTNSYAITWKGADNGRVIHHVPVTGLTQVFPIGDQTEYTPFQITLSSATLNNGTISASVSAMAHAQKGSSTSYLNRVWTVEPFGITNPQYNVEYHFATSDVTGDPATLFPAKFSNGSWQSCQESNSNANMGNGSVNAPLGTLTWTGLNSFSEFTAFGNGSPLPVELLVFDAAPKDEQVAINWMTASETNNDYFIVQRSADAKHFTDLEKVPGAGNTTNIRKYLSSDPNPLRGISYYRLKQVDYNGQTSYSQVIPVRFDGNNVLRLESFNALPDQQQIQFRLTNSPDNQAAIVIFDAAGKNIYQSQPGNVSKNWQATVSLGALPRGVYIASFRLNGQFLNRKFVY